MSDATDPSQSASPTTPSTTPPAGVDPSLGAVVEQARADLAGRLGVPEAAITVVSAKPVTWPDSSLGCPQPGMAYLQVLTDGSRILLEHADRQYAYHSGGRSPAPFLCERTEGPFRTGR